MRIGFFVDGPNDRSTIQILVTKLLARRDPKPGTEFRVLPWGHFFEPRKTVAHLSFLLRQHRDIRKVVFYLDTECRSPVETRQKLSSAEQAIRESGLRVAPVYCLKVHALESWLAADRQALRTVLGEGPMEFQNPENVCKPKDLLEEVYRRAGRKYVYTRDNLRIAEAIDVGTLRRNSGSFAEFCNALESA